MFVCLTSSSVVLALLLEVCHIWVLVLVFYICLVVNVYIWCCIGFIMGIIDWLVYYWVFIVYLGLCCGFLVYMLVYM